jgi:hypothetical protein
MAAIRQAHDSVSSSWQGELAGLLALPFLQTDQSKP